MLTVQKPAPYVLSPYFYNETEAFSSDATRLNDAYRNVFIHSTDTLTTQTLAQRFYALSQAWKADHRFSSSINTLLLNPAYLAIIAMGKKALPFIFSDWATSPNHWFPALAIITGVNPVREEDRGNVSAMAQSWMNWAFQNGYATRT